MFYEAEERDEFANSESEARARRVGPADEIVASLGKLARTNDRNKKMR